MPKVWAETIDPHRVAVRDSVPDAAEELIEEHGLLGLTMSDLAAQTGIGRATLYKYFPAVDDVVSAWHERLVGRHVAHLGQVASRFSDPWKRLRSVLTAYAHMRASAVGH